ncbi:MAG TPA: MFS transporter [Actinomycetota bacterium]|nr:MFS transporter [Actinomycetota bacterium]
MVAPPPPVAPPPYPARPSRLRLKILRPLQHRDFSLLWLGLSVSLVGDGIFFVAMPLQVLELSNSPGATASVGAAWTAPQVAFLLVGGILSDRLDRRRILILADIVRVVPMLLLGLLSLSGSLELWHMYVLVAVYGLGDALFGPAFGSIVPDVVPRELLVEANSLDNFTRPFAMRVVGPLLYPIIFAFTGQGGAFLVNAGTFVFSAIALTMMRSLPAARRERATPSMLEEIKEGLAFVVTQRWLWASLVAMAAGLLCFYGPFQAIVPYVLKNRGGNEELSLVMAATGVGAIVGAVLLTQFSLPRRHVTMMYATLAIGVLMLSGFGIFHDLWQTVIVGLLMSGFFTVGTIIWNTLMHTHVPRHLLGRVSSVDWFVTTSLIPLSQLLASPATKTWGAEDTLIGAGVLGSIVLFGFWLAIRGAERTLLNAESDAAL